MLERRRTDRVFLRIPIRVQGMDQTGGYFSEETATVEVNRDGARISLRSPLRMGDELRVTILVTGAAALCRVTVQCPNSLGDSPEWGMALSTSMSDVVADFWGISFEDLPEEAQPHIAALLSCTACGRRELVTLSQAEYDVLRDDLTFPRVCQNCRTPTDWEPVDLTRPWPPASDDDQSPRGGGGTKSSPREPGPSGSRGGDAGPAGTSSAGRGEPMTEKTAGTDSDRGEPQNRAAGVSRSAEIGRGVRVQEVPAGVESTASTATTEVPRNGFPGSAPPESAKSGSAPPHQAYPVGGINPDEAEGGPERRMARRVLVRVPILVQAPNGATEETVTRDISKTGLSFPTNLGLSRGDSIEVVVGHGVMAAPVRQRATVAWRRPDTPGVRAMAAAQFVTPVEPERQGPAGRKARA